VRWLTGISILSYALSGAVFAIAGIAGSKDTSPSSQSIIVADNAGRTALLDTLLPAGEIGLVVAAGSKKETADEKIAADVGDDSGYNSEYDIDDEGWLSPKTASKKTAPKKSASAKPASSKKPAASKPSSAKSTSSPKPKPPAPDPADLPCVNINAADESGLTSLKGIGPATAAAILEHRAANGPFNQKEDILKVKGIGPAKFAGIVDRICL
jgi:competence protein ComEA